MCVVNEDGYFILEPGEFSVFIGGSEPDFVSEILTGNKVLSANFTVK